MKLFSFGYKISLWYVIIAVFAVAASRFLLPNIMQMGGISFLLGIAIILILNALPIALLFIIAGLFKSPRLNARREIASRLEKIARRVAGICGLALFAPPLIVIASCAVGGGGGGCGDLILFFFPFYLVVLPILVILAIILLVESMRR